MTIEYFDCAFVTTESVWILSFLGQRGREGHWGLPGIRERAKVIGGRLEVWSELSRGTEVELTLPAKAAYDPSGHAGSGTPKTKKRPGA